MKINKWVNRTGTIMAGAIKESGQDYTANLSQFMIDAKQVRTRAMQVAHNSKDTYNKMKNNGGLGKQFTDWFFSKGNQFMDSDLTLGDDDEFDAGFHGFDGDDSNNEDVTPNVSTLHASDMKHIARGSVKEMYGMFGQLTQSNMANTAEIVSTLNNRGSETITALNNMSSILRTISKKMDVLTPMGRDSEPEKENGLYDAQGRVTLSSFEKAFGSSMKNNPLFSTLSMASDAKEMITPEFLISSILDLSGIKDKKQNVLGDQSINEIGHTFNNAVGSSVNDVLTNVMDTELFQTIFGDLNESKISRDYSIGSQYDTKAAVFDGMTRSTIVSIIPEYLKNITNALSGQTLNINAESGALVSSEKMKDQFHSVGKEAFRSSGMSWKNVDQRDHIMTDNNLDDEDKEHIPTAFSSLNLAFVNWLHDDVKLQTLHKKYLHSGNTARIEEASVLMAAKTGLSKQKCKRIITTILARFENPQYRSEADEFIVSVKSNLERLRTEAQKRASIVTDNSTQLYRNGLRQITSENFVDEKQGKRIDPQLKEEYNRLKTASEQKMSFGEKGKNRTEKAKDELKTLLELHPELNKVSARNEDVSIKKPQKNIQSKLNQMDFMRGIFTRLNTGINVKVVNVDKDGELYPDRYKDLKLQHKEEDSHTGTLYLPEESVIGNGEINKEDGDVGFSDQMKNIFVNPIKNAFKGLIPEPLKKRMNEFIDKTGAKDKVNEIKTRAKDTKIGGKLGTIKDTIVGKKEVTDEEGNVTQQEKPGSIHTIKNRVTNIGSNVLSGMKNKALNTIDHMDGFGKKDIQKNMESYQKQSNDLSSNDQAFVQAATTAMQASITSGETSDDFSDIMSSLDKMENKEMAKHMKKTMGGMLRRNEKKDGKKGIFGKLVSGLLLGFKSIFGFVIRPVISALRFIGKGIGKLFKTFLNMFKNGAKLAGSGFKDVGRSLFGQKEKTAKEDGMTRVDKDGNVLQTYQKGDVVQGKEEGLLQMAGKRVLFGKEKETIAGTDKAVVNRMADGSVRDADGNIYAADMTETSRTGGIMGITKKALFGSDKFDINTLKGGGIMGIVQKGLFGKAHDVGGEYAREGGLLGKIQKGIFGENGVDGKEGLLSKVTNKISDFSQKTMEKMGPMFDKLKGSSIGKAIGSIGTKASSVGTNLIDKATTQLKEKGFRSRGNWDRQEQRAEDSAFYEERFANNETRPNEENGAATRGIKDATAGFMDKFKESEFGKGFMGVFGKKDKIIAKSPENFGDTQLEKQTSILEEIRNLLDPQKKNKSNNTTPSTPRATDESADNTSPTNTEEETKRPGMMDRLTNRVRGNRSETETQSTSRNRSTGSRETGTSGTGSRTTSASATRTQTTGSGASARGGVSTGGDGKGSMLTKIGGAVGGIVKILGGFGQMLAAAVMSLASVQTLMSLVQKTMTTIVKPLEKLFKAIVKGIQPILQGVGEAVVEIITPIIELLLPLITQIFDIIGPILDIITDLTKAVMIPIMLILENVVVPILRTVGNSLQFIMGILQIGFGVLQVALGSILTAIGWIVETLTFGLISGVKDSGLKMVKDGGQMVKDGGKSMVDAVINQAKLMGEMLGFIKEEQQETPDISHTPEQRTQNLGDVGMDGGEYGSGDVYNTYQNTYNNYRDSNNKNITNHNSSNSSSSDIHNIYGSGDEMNQKAYGNYLNMKDRGCGPAVLADAYNRRLYGSGPVNAAQVATGMYQSGEYEPTRGTSVSGMIHAGNSMGLGLRPGGVTQRSLGYSSPRNPITLIGSGTAFGTRRGNDHYVNVVGTRGSVAYVSNPLTGRTSQQPIGSLVNGSRMGLYGSGDITTSGYPNIYGGAGEETTTGLFKFSEETTGSFRKLQSIANNLTGMFSFEKSTQEELEDQRKATIAKDQERNADLMMENYKDLSVAEKKMTDEMAIYLWWLDEIPEEDEELYKIMGGAWATPSDCRSDENTPYPDQQKFRDVIATMIQNNKTEKEIYPDDPTKNYSYILQMTAYRKKFINKARTINEEKCSDHIPVNLSVCDKEKQLVVTCSCNDCKTKQRAIPKSRQTTPMQAWKEIPDIPEGNAELIRKTYTAKATGMYLAEERKESSERADINSKLTATDTEKRNEQTALNICPQCGNPIGKGPSDCAACNAYNNKTGNSSNGDGSINNAGGYDYEVALKDMISNCGSNETGGLVGGKPGDQTGSEYEIKKWKSRPWTHVLRHDNDAVKSKLAAIAVDAAKNDHIGYDQPTRNTYNQELAKVNWDPSAIQTDCAADCSSSTASNIIATGHQLGIDELKSVHGYLTTRTIRNDLSNRNFTTYTDSYMLNSPDYLLPGDVLLKEGSHVAINLGIGGNIEDSIKEKFRNTNDTTGGLEGTGMTSERKPKVIWDFLNNKGLTKSGTAGLMGNLEAESGLIPINLQNYYEKTSGMTDDSYTTAVDNGSYGNFANDQFGYGLAQWTDPSRKQNLLNHVKNGGSSIGNLGAQLNFLWDELQNYGEVISTLKTTNGIRQASDTVLSKYERPANQSSYVQEARASLGQDFYNTYASGDIGIPDYEIPQILSNNVNPPMPTDQQSPIITIDGVVAEMKSDQLTRILKNKFLVEDSKTHRLLSLILKKLEERKQSISQKQTTSSVSLHDLFNEEIPEEYAKVLM